VGLATALLFLANDGDDLRVHALGSQRECGRRLGVRIDSTPGIGAVLHEQPCHLKGAIRNRVVDCAVLGPSHPC